MIVIKQISKEEFITGMLFWGTSFCRDIVNAGWEDARNVQLGKQDQRRNSGSQASGLGQRDKAIGPHAEVNNHGQLDAALQEKIRQAESRGLGGNSPKFAQWSLSSEEWQRLRPRASRQERREAVDGAANSQPQGGPRDTGKKPSTQDTVGDSQTTDLCRSLGALNVQGKASATRTNEKPQRLDEPSEVGDGVHGRRLPVSFLPSGTSAAAKQAGQWDSREGSTCEEGPAPEAACLTLTQLTRMLPTHGPVGPVVAIDIETTGLSVHSDAIIEVAAYNLNSGEMMESLVNLGDARWSSKAGKVHGIKKEWVTAPNVPTWGSVAKALVAWLEVQRRGVSGGLPVLVAHNGKR